MAYGLSNGHVTDDVTWPWKDKLVTSIRLERNISKTAGDRDSVPKDHQQEIIYGLSNGHVTDDWWPQRCCDETQSAILATAWLLVTFPVVKTRADKMCAYEEMIWSWHRAIDVATVHSETTIDWLIDWLSMILRLHQHNIGYTPTVFTGQMTQPTVSKRWRRAVSHPDRPQSNQAHLTVLE